jgi:hypothetical protein
MNRIRLDSLANRVQSASRRIRTSSEDAAVPSEWALRRGDQRYAGTFDVIGNFPGFEEVAGLIVNAAISVTDRFLIVDEGAPHGFALGIGFLVDVSADPDPDTFGDVLIRYRSDEANVIFRLRPSRSRLALRSRGKPEDLVGALSDAGADVADLARDVADTLRLSWDSVQSLETEAVIWRGQATAPLRPGLECAPASVWVTPTALVWGSSKGRGVNRLPISTIMRLSAITLPDEAGSPTVYVRSRVISDVRLDLPFIFNLTPVRDGVTARSEFLGLFRPDAVIEGTVSARPQPWLEETPVAPGDEEEDVVVLPGSDAEGQEPDAHPADDSGESDTEAADSEPEFETWANLVKPTMFPYVPPVEGGRATHRLAVSAAESAEPHYDPTGTRLSDAIASWPGATSHDHAPAESESPGITEPDRIPAYLAAAQRAIDEVTEAIDRRIAGNAAPPLRATPPAAHEQAAALAELIELTGSDYYSAEQARRVKARITRFGEAAVRLRSLIELCNAGHLTIHEVGAKRDAIMANLPAVAEDE